ncbi:MAG: kelch repeat-containing protein [Allorhizobium sp.]
MCIVEANKLLVLGGRFGKNPLPCNEYYLLDFDSWKWSRYKKVMNAPKRRFGHSLTPIGELEVRLPLARLL